MTIAIAVVLFHSLLAAVLFIFHRSEIGEDKSSLCSETREASILERHSKYFLYLQASDDDGGQDPVIEWRANRLRPMAQMNKPKGRVLGLWKPREPTRSWRNPSNVISEQP
ncbi:hypothetical protein OGR47_07420 [Methylocystis sp. MJC1]|jgi:hypothetical protein|uniref:hypothetical protein n=1 Tax=Methylocystis sp. MJC1 TaxID=2654282 RepID=UPI0013EC59BF|nr:hypothetical protein [Methylocystis sp. MJC1]UZX13258.1 hypothetical protein OGR47_07420 [Methylocystis sp. MJC1]